MEHLSERAKRAKAKRQLKDTHIALALRMVSLTNQNCELLLDIADQISDYQRVAAFRATIEEKIRVKSEGGAPGNPTVAKWLLDADHEQRLIKYQLDNDLKKSRKRLRQLALSLELKMANYEGRTDISSKNSKGTMPTSAESLSC